MAILHLRGVPDDLYEALVQRARERGSSVTKETIRLLRRALAIEPSSQRELIDEILATRVQLGPGATPAEELIREDRDR